VAAGPSALPSRFLLPFPVALAVTFGMALVYTGIDLLQLAEPVQSLVSFSPALASLAALRAAGFSREELHLRFKRISRLGAVSLAGVSLLLLPILGSSTAWTGWRLLPALVYAPASGIAQELYFRSALLSSLGRASGGRKNLALAAHAFVFTGFHLRTFLSLPSVAVALVVAAVLFTGGLGWGWQVGRDRTIVWAMLQHCAFLMLMSMFAW
jgi:hypothetical protein